MCYSLITQQILMTKIVVASDKCLTEALETLKWKKKKHFLTMPLYYFFDIVCTMIETKLPAVSM